MPGRNVCTQSASEVNLRPLKELIKGRTAFDPEGTECRIGAWWARLFLRRGWALAAARRVWFKNEEAFERFCRDPHWRAHERHHLKQEREDFRGSTLRYLATIIWQYVRYLSHDKAPMELAAEAAAEEAFPSVREHPDN